MTLPRITDDLSNIEDRFQDQYEQTDSGYELKTEGENDIKKALRQK